MIPWTTAASAVSASFIASAVEAAEAFTIVLVVGMLQGWRPAIFGTIAALGTLGLMVLCLGPMLTFMPLHLLQISIGILLLLFGMGWLRKAILRSAGVIPVRDEASLFIMQKKGLEDAASRHAANLHWTAGIMAFKAVFLEGLEVVFIVTAVSAGNGLLVPASIGAIAACMLVLFVGILIRRPLSQIPENTLKFAVGVLLSAFGVFWAGEGLGIPWPGHDLILFVFAGIFLLTGTMTATLLRAHTTRGL